MMNAKLTNAVTHLYMRLPIMDTEKWLKLLLGNNAHVM